MVVRYRRGPAVVAEAKVATLQAQLTLAPSHWLGVALESSDVV